MCQHKYALQFRNQQHKFQFVRFFGFIFSIHAAYRAWRARIWFFNFSNFFFSRYHLHIDFQFFSFIHSSIIRCKWSKKTFFRSRSFIIIKKFIIHTTSTIQRIEFNSETEMLLMNLRQIVKCWKWFFIFVKKIFMMNAAT